MEKIYDPILSNNVKERTSFKFLWCLAILLAAFSLNAQQTYTFTTATAVGATGPSQTMINSAYLSTNLAGSVVATNGIQTFTVPSTGLYLIDITGASGGNTNTTYNRTGGLGARMAGQFNLTGGTVLSILVGQAGVNGCGTGGGGGGSYVVANGTTLLIAAGGGGGASSDNNGANAVTTMTGTNDSPGGAIPGGVNGLGGSACNIANGGANHGGGGGGYLGNGATSTAPTPGGGGLAYVNGGTGGTGNAPGGFGGGGGGTNCTVGGGGGGGYSGGAGGQQVNYCMSGLNRTGGGGGGSLNSGTSQTNTPGVNLGDGRVILRDLCNVFIYSSATNSLAPAICAGNSLTLTTNSIGSFTWSNSNTTNTSIVVSPVTNTVYSITGTGANSCIATSSISVIVNSGVPALTITPTSTTICQGRSVTLTATGALSYVWTGSITNGVGFVPTVSNSYVVTGQNGCGTSTAVANVSVTPLPVTGSASPTVVCVGNAAALTLTTFATSYTWQPGNVVTSVPNLFVSPTVTTVYSVTVSDGTCSGTASMNVVSNPVPTITSSSSNATLCPGQSATLTASGGLNYTWTPGNIVSQTISVSPTISSAYNVVGNNSFSCTGTSGQVILVGAQPTISATNPSQLICSGKSATLIAGGAGSYVWTNGPTTNSYVVSPTQNTTYTVTGTSANAPCPATRVFTVNVHTPNIVVTGPSSICVGQTATLTASGAANYSWSPVNLIFPSITVSPTITSIYTVDAISNTLALNCPVQGTVQVIVNQNPTVTATANKNVICRNEKITLTGGGANTYIWSNLTTTLGTAAIHTVNASPAGVMQFTLTGTNAEGCSSTKALQVSILACNGVTEKYAGLGLNIYPNPNSGEFYIESSEERNLVLYNELGQTIRSIKLNAGNSYRVNVHDLSKGIYFIGDEGSLNKEKIVVD